MPFGKVVLAVSLRLTAQLCATKSEHVSSAPQVWLHAPYELHLSLFEHFIELLTESRQVAKKDNAQMHPLTFCTLLIRVFSFVRETARRRRMPNCCGSSS